MSTNAGATEKRQSHTDNGLTNPDDNLRAPTIPGRPPRPATEPAGAEHSTRNRHSETDPATGIPTPGERAEKLDLPDGPFRD